MSENQKILEITGLSTSGSQSCSFSSDFVDPLKQLSEFEHLISLISTKFSNLDASQVDEEIENGLRMIVEFFFIQVGE